MHARELLRRFRDHDPPLSNAALDCGAMGDRSGACVVAVLVVALGVLGGCTPGSVGPMSSSSPGITITPTPTPTATPRELLPHLTLQCDGDDGRDYVFTDFRDVWPLKSFDCTSELSDIETDVEKRAAALLKSDDPASLDRAYVTCAENSSISFGRLTPNETKKLFDSGWGDVYESISGDIQDYSAALILCPDHPQRKKISARISQYKEDLKYVKEAQALDVAERKAKQEAKETRDRLIKEGRIFDSGLYRVNKEIKPGAYVSKNVTNCYWERQNRNGDIVANNFYREAARVQVTIRSSDYAFMSEGCSEWRPA